MRLESHFAWGISSNGKFDEAFHKLGVNEAEQRYIRTHIMILDVRELEKFCYSGEGNVYAKRRQPTYSYWDCLHGYLTAQNASAIFNAPLLRQCGGFDTSLRFVMDYDIILKLGKIGPVVHVPKFCGAFRVHEDSKTTTIDDVCQRETEELRTRYGVTQNQMLRRIMQSVAKLRVYSRMLFQGCMKDRLY